MQEYIIYYQGSVVGYMNIRKKLGECKEHLRTESTITFLVGAYAAYGGPTLLARCLAGRVASMVTILVTKGLINKLLINNQVDDLMIDIRFHSGQDWPLEGN